MSMRPVGRHSAHVVYEAPGQMLSLCLNRGLYADTQLMDDYEARLFNFELFRGFVLLILMYLMCP